MTELTLWRLSKKQYARSAFEGEGARRYGGRWGSKGTPLVYVAENLPLALLETLVGLSDYEALYQYVFFRVRLAARHVETIEQDALPADWDERPPARTTRQFGDAWAEDQRSVALRVPSVVVPHSFNYVLNPAHPRFDALDVHAPETLPVDRRLVRP